MIQSTVTAYPISSTSLLFQFSAQHYHDAFLFTDSIFFSYIFECMYAHVGTLLALIYLFIFSLPPPTLGNLSL